MGNSIIFNAPKPSYTETSFLCRLSYIEKPEEVVEQASVFSCKCSSKYFHRKLPYVYFQKTVSMQKRQLFIYFHANSEDLGLCYPLLESIHDSLQVDVFAVEYPGYGIYKGESNEQQMRKDALIAYEYVMLNLTNEYQQEDIFIVGRSLGSGPGLHLCSQIANIGGIILISSFYSIRQVVQEKVGNLIASLTTPDIFKNYETIQKIMCPILFIHGQNDEISSLQSIEKLYSMCSSDIKQLIVKPDMNHSTFSFEKDLKEPIQKFLEIVDNSLQYKNKLSCNSSRIHTLSSQTSLQQFTNNFSKLDIL